MTFEADIGQSVRRTGPRLSRVVLPALLFAIAGLGLSLWRDMPMWRDGFMLMTGLMLVLTAFAKARVRPRRSGLSREARARIAALEADPAPSFLSCADGEIRYRNDAAKAALGARTGDTVASAVRVYMSNPAALIMRLTTKTRAAGAAQEDVVTRNGHVRISVRRITDREFGWRVELFPQKAASQEGAAQISLPMLTVSKTGTILFMNDALRRLVGRRVRALDRLFAELPVRGGELRDLTTPDGPVEVMVIEGAETPGRRELYLAPTREEMAHKAAVGAMDGLPIALLKLDSDGRVLSSNALARQLLGISEGERRPFSALVEGLGRPMSDWMEMLASGKALRRPEVVRARRDAGEVYIQITPERVVENGDPHVLMVLSDVTEIKTLEARVVQAQKMQAIGQLAGGVAHDFNNLLTAITGHCDLLLLRHDKGDGDYADLQQINQNANRAASLVSQLLAFSRKQTLRPQRIDLRDALADLTHLLNRLVGEKVALSLTHDPDLRPTRADKRQLEQVIMNLVVNARDALSEEGGDVRISTANVHFDKDVLRERATIPAGDYVLIRVADNGCGIPRDKMTAIFEPFYTTKKAREGTGLGLSTAYGIVKQTGGFIFVESVVGSGTEFSVFLPAADPNEPCEAPAAPVAPMASTARGDGVVLIVEDEAPVRAFASRALRLRGYTVLEAEDGEQALAVLEDETLEIDLFVTDVIMPGLDGPSWVRRAHEKRPDVRVIFVSGYAEEPIAEDQSRIANSVFLPKPFSLADLTATVQRQLSG